MLNYSVVIRTLGNAGEKYQRLISSIQSQTVPPEAIIVVLPSGYNLDYITGFETIVYSEKGMVSQRAEGIIRCSSDYMLVVDDDVEFGYDMVEQLYKYLVENHLDCCLPMEGEPSCDGEMTFSLPFLSRLRNVFTGQVFMSKHDDGYLDRITLTAGHRVFSGRWNPEKCYLTNTGNFQCFFIKSDISKAVHLEDEVWLQEGSLTSYSSYDDPTFFYKLYLSGCRIGYSMRTRYKHLDASVGRPAKSLLESKIIRYYSVSRNRTIFWYKFLWRPSMSLFKRAEVLACGLYGAFNYAIWNMAICISPAHWPAVKAMFCGYRDAMSFIHDYRRQCLKNR